MTLSRRCEYAVRTTTLAAATATQNPRFRLALPALHYLPDRGPHRVEKKSASIVDM